MRVVMLSVFSISVISPVILPSAAFAQEFEIIDGSAEVAGEPATSTAEARSNWNFACEKFKAETKEYNRGDQIMLLSCDNPICAFSSDTGKTTCTSMANFKVKTQGTRVRAPEPVVVQQPVVQHPAPQVRETTVIYKTMPPSVVYERPPAPRLGFLWIAGFWHFHNRNYVWVPGRWERRHEVGPVVRPIVRPIVRRPHYVWSDPHWPHRRDTHPGRGHAHGHRNHRGRH